MSPTSWQSLGCDDDSHFDMSLVKRTDEQATVGRVRPAPGAASGAAAATRIRERIWRIENEVERGLTLQEYHEALMEEHRRVLIKIADLEAQASKTWDKVQEVKEFLFSISISRSNNITVLGTK